jgi:hypothetical protein
VRLLLLVFLVTRVRLSSSSKSLPSSSDEDGDDVISMTFATGRLRFGSGWCAGSAIIIVEASLPSAFRVLLPLLPCSSTEGSSFCRLGWGSTPGRTTASKRATPCKHTDGYECKPKA